MVITEVYIISKALPLEFRDRMTRRYLYNKDLPLTFPTDTEPQITHISDLNVSMGQRSYRKGKNTVGCQGFVHFS